MGELTGACLRNSPVPRETWSYSVAPSRHEHRSDVRKRATTNHGPVSVLRSRESVISRGEFYWIHLAATENQLSNPFPRLSQSFCTLTILMSTLKEQMQLGKRHRR